MCNDGCVRADNLLQVIYAAMVRMFVAHKNNIRPRSGFDLVRVYVYDLTILNSESVMP
jgi:hypothetical protein